MSDVDDTKRWSVSFHRLAETTCNTSNCPDPDQLWAAVSEEATPSERRAVIEHTASCPACAEDWRIAVSLANSAESAQLTPETDHGLTTSRAHHRWLWASATVVISGMAAGLILILNPPSQDIESTSILRGGTASETVHVEGYEFESMRFEWPDSGADAEYELWIVDSDFSPIRTIEGLRKPSYEVPSDLAEGLRRHVTFYWQVKSLRPDGQTETSPTIIARLYDL